MAITLSAGTGIEEEWEFDTIGDLYFYYTNSSSELGSLKDWFKPLTNVLSTEGIIDFVDIPMSMSLKNSTELELQKSYDNSVNMIFVDGENSDKIINSRFIVNEDRSASIAERGNDTNIYNINSIDEQTSLVKTSEKPAIIDLENVGEGGSLPAGNYIFYIRYSDEDNNESNVVGESGLVSIFLGSITTSSKIRGGVGEQDCGKSVTLRISNLNTAFSQIKVYIARTVGEDYNSDPTTVYYSLDDLYEFESNEDYTDITISNLDNATTVDSIDVTEDSSYNISSSITQCQNILFKGNISGSTVDTFTNLKLEELSTRIIPEISNDETIGFVDHNYNDVSNLRDSTRMYEYLNPHNIYYRLGYWNEELYRFGVIFKIGSEYTSVFNIRGGILKGNTLSNFTDISIDETLIDNDSYLSTDGYFKNSDGYENIYGVSKFDSNKSLVVGNNIYPYGIKFTITSELLDAFKDLGVDGFYFVRQDRIPEILGQGVTLGLNPQSRTPTILIQSEQYEGEIYYDKEFEPLNYTIQVSYLHETPFSRSMLIGDYTSKLHIEYNDTDDSLTDSWDFIRTDENFVSGSLQGMQNTRAPSDAGIGSSKSLLSMSIYMTFGNTEGYSNYILYPFKNNYVNKYADDYSSKNNYGDFMKLHTDGFRFSIRSTSKDKNTSTVIDDGYDIDTFAQIKNNVLISPDIQLLQSIYEEVFVSEEYNLSSVRNLNYDYFTINKKDRICFVNKYIPKDDISITSWMNYISSNKFIYSNTKARVTIGEGFESGVDDLNMFDNSYLKSKQYRYGAGGDDIENNFRRPFVYGFNSFAARGKYTNYLGIYSDDDIPYGLYNIRKSDINLELKSKFNIRKNTSADYFKVSNYVEIPDITSDISEICYKGDCYITNYSQRMLRNFADESTEKLDYTAGEQFVSGIEYKTNLGSGNYLNEDTTEFEVDTSKITTKYMDSVKLGHWINIKCCSNINGNLRSPDTTSNYSYYPNSSTDVLITTDKEEAFNYNLAYSQYPTGLISFNSETNVVLNNNSNRIVYSDKMSQTSLTNNYSIFDSEHYRDYFDAFGSISKIIELNSTLIVVFERGVCVIAVNERAIAGEAEGNTIYINTSNVLPENPFILSSSYGTTWKESVVKSSRYVYGFDIISKKIWRTDGKSFEVISDLKINEYISNNSRLYNSFKSGTTNVKTHFNEFKQDIMFTLYDTDPDDVDTKYGFNICFNELTGNFSTFYNWTPVASANSGNKYISFDLDKIKLFDTFGDSNESLEIWKHGTNPRFDTLTSIKPTMWYSDYTGVTNTVGEYVNGDVAGKQYKFSFEFIVLDVPSLQKIFNNLDIISNKATPESFIFEVCGESYSFYELKDLIYEIQNLTDTELLTDNYLYNILNDNGLLNKGIPYIPIVSDEELPTLDNTTVPQSYLTEYSKLNEFRTNTSQKGLDVKKVGRIRGNMEYLEDTWKVEMRPFSYVKKYLSASDSYSTIRTTKKNSAKIRDKYLKIKVIYSGEDLAIISAIRTMFTVSFS